MVSLQFFYQYIFHFKKDFQIDLKVTQFIENFKELYVLFALKHRKINRIDS